MQITSVYPYSQNNNVQKQKLFSFGYRLPNRTFTDIKDIPKLTCGCCGNVMITTQEFLEFIKTFKPGALKALKSKVLEPYKGTPSYTFVEKYALKHPKTPVSKLITMPEAALEMKTLKLKTQGHIQELAQIADTISVSAPKVIKKLDKFRHLYNKENKDILDIMEIYALKYPKRTFYEIFNMPEVKDYHTKILQLHKEKNTLQRTNVFKQIKKISEKLNEDDMKLLLKANADTLAVLNNDSYKNNITKELITAVYNDFAKNCTDKKTAQKIVKASKDFQFERFIPDSFIVRSINDKKTDSQIIENILSDLRATFEHIKAKSKDGKYVQENGIALCRSCNQERSNLPYPFFLKIHPEMIKNAQKQINKIISFIKGDRLIDYDNYPLDVKKTLIKETDSIIKLNIKKFFKNKELASNAELEIAKALSAESEKDYQLAHQKYMEAQRQLKEALETVNKIKLEAARFRTEANTAHTQKMHFENIVDTAKEKLNKILQLKETDKALDMAEKI